jgi:hypothetical protein
VEGPISFLLSLLDFYHFDWSVTQELIFLVIWIRFLLSFDEQRIWPERLTPHSQGQYLPSYTKQVSSKLYSSFRNQI